MPKACLSYGAASVPWESILVSSAKAAQTQKIAKARAHVERSVQRSKVFKLSKGPIPWELPSVISDAMLVLAGTVNSLRQFKAVKSSVNNEHTGFRRY